MQEGVLRRLDAEKGVDLLATLKGWDLDLLLMVNRGLANPSLTWIMRAVTDVRNWIPVLAIVAVVLLWMGRTRPVATVRTMPAGGSARINPRVVLVCLVLAVIVSDQAAYRLKHLVPRSRPCRDDAVSTLVEARWDVSGNRSFPSSHAANSAALATVGSLAYPPITLPCMLLAFAVGFSRVYLGVHYPLDVFGGWMLGYLSGLVVWILLRKKALKGGIIGLANRFRTRQIRPGFDPPPPWSIAGAVSADGYPLRCFYLQPAEGNGRAAVLVHGLGGDISGLVLMGEIFVERGFTAFLVPLRGHDGHPCGITTGGPGEASDVVGVLRALREAGYDPAGTVVYGCSMGGAAAVKAAGLMGEMFCGGVICHGSFRDFFESARNRMGRTGEAVLRLLMPAGAVHGLEVFDPVAYLGLASAETSFVFMHGTSDRITPPFVGKALAEAARKGLQITLRKSPHPAWLVSHVDRTQMLAAVDTAIAFIDGGLGGSPVVLDEYGNLHIVPPVHGMGSVKEVQP